MKQLKTQKGITLIALIISIIVLLVLAVVTMGSMKNSGIISRSEEAKFKTEVKQIQEQLELKKMEVVLDNIGVKVNRYNITIANLDIADGLKTKYDSKLTISEEGILYYKADGVTEVEIQWLDDLGIQAYGFIPNVRVLANNNVYTEYGNKRNFYKTYEDIKAKYPNATIMTLMYETYLHPADIIYLAAKGYNNLYEAKKELETKYPNAQNELITAEVENILKAKINNSDDYIRGNNTVQDILNEMDTNLKEGLSGDNISSYYVINGEEKVLITHDNIIENYQPHAELIIMKETEAKEKFNYTETLLEGELIKGSRNILFFYYRRNNRI